LNYYCYAWLREDGSPYYIGKGKGPRAYVKHETMNPPERERIAIIKDDMLEEDAYRLETALIRFYGRKDIGTGILRNMSEGGKGARGFNEVVIEKYRLLAKERVKADNEFGFTPERSSVTQRRKIEEGTHCFIDPSFQSDMGRRSVETLKVKGTYGPAQEWTCEHCGKQGKNKTNYIRFHGNNCKECK
jgi:hypothetical protein